jgi:hypothetical protein
MSKPKTLDEKTLDEIAPQERPFYSAANATWRKIHEEATAVYQDVEIIRAALQQARDLGRAERDKEWQRAVLPFDTGTFTREPEQAGLALQANFRVGVREALADERKALREIVEGIRDANVFGRASVKQEILAALAARESAPAERCGSTIEPNDLQYRCELVVGHTGEHVSGNLTWASR